MTGPVARVHELAGEAVFLTLRAVELADAGLYDAALALRDQSEAAEGHARRVALESGNEALIALWDEQ